MERNRLHSTGWIILTLLGAVVTRGAAAQENEREAPARGRFAQQVRERRRDARQIRESFAVFVSERDYLRNVAGEDWPKLKEATERQALLCERAAEVLEREDEREAQQLNKQIEKAGEVAELWRFRIGEIRKRQAESTPRESSTVGELRWLRRGTLEHYWALVHARRAVAEAWRDLAEATVPGADQALLNTLWDKAYAADITRETVEWRFNFAQRRSEIWNDPQVSSDELQARFAEYERIMQARVNIRLGDIARDRQMRELERQARRLDRECQRAFDRAREARERDR